MWLNIFTIFISAFAVCVSIYTFRWVSKRDLTRDTINAYEDLQTFLYHFYEYPSGEIETFVDDKTSEEYKALSNSLARLVNIPALVSSESGIWKPRFRRLGNRSSGNWEPVIR